MRLFPNQIKAIEEIIIQVTQYGQVLDKELKKVVERNRKWGSRDRRNMYQTAYDIVRNYELLDFLSKEYNKGIIGTYLDSLVDLAIDFEDIEKKYPKMPFYIRHSIPEDVYNIYERESKHHQENIQAMQRVGDIFIRVNTSLTTMKKFESLLKENDVDYECIESFKIEDSELTLNAIKIVHKNAQQRAFFNKYSRYFEVQDIGAQILTESIDFSEAKTIIEGCAGNGGKTCHIIDKTIKNDSLMITFDKRRKTIEHLQKRIKKWTGHKVVTELAKPKEIEKYENMADILYLDVPCTGSGTLKRQSDIKYRISEDVLKERIQTQREIFHNFNSTLKKGGTLVYTTCSLFKSENEDQADFISKNGFELIESFKLEPKDYEGDGFFMAKFVKT